MVQLRHLCYFFCPLILLEFYLIHLFKEVTFNDATLNLDYYFFLILKAGGMESCFQSLTGFCNIIYDVIGFIQEVIRKTLS